MASVKCKTAVKAGIIGVMQRARFTSAVITVLIVVIVGRLFAADDSINSSLPMEDF